MGLYKSNSAWRAMRGGGYWNLAWRCRSAFRGWYDPGGSGRNRGFRLVAGPAKTGQESARAERSGAAVDSLAEQFDMVSIKGGSFVMGSPEGEPDRDEDETQHKVNVAAFSIGATPVTNAQYASLIADHQVAEVDATKPVTNVTWFDAVAYCAELNKRTGGDYRLPTEEEWEYACRAGSTTAYCFGDDVTELNKYAWYGGSHTHPIAQKLPNKWGLHPVAQKKPNAWGLYDMHGNVWEWCSDKYEVE